MCTLCVLQIIAALAKFAALVLHDERTSASEQRAAADVGAPGVLNVTLSSLQHALKVRFASLELQCIFSHTHILYICA